MTRKEFDKFKELYYNTLRYGDNKKMDEIISCISMIDSHIAYDNYDSEDYDILKSRYMEKYVKSLGEKIVLQLFEQQKKQVVRVDRCVHTDSEGCSYNSIVWVDD